MPNEVTQCLRALDDAKDERRRNNWSVAVRALLTVLALGLLSYGVYMLSYQIPLGPMRGPRMLHTWLAGLGGVLTAVMGLATLASVDRISYRRKQVREANYDYLDAMQDQYEAVAEE